MALHLALQRPSRVAGLVLIAPALNHTTRVWEGLEEQQREAAVVSGRIALASDFVEGGSVEVEVDTFFGQGNKLSLGGAGGGESAAAAAGAGGGGDGGAAAAAATAGGSGGQSDTQGIIQKIDVKCPVRILHGMQVRDTAPPPPPNKRALYFKSLNPKPPLTLYHMHANEHNLRGMIPGDMVAA